MSAKKHFWTSEQAVLCAIIQFMEVSRIRQHKILLCESLNSEPNDALCWVKEWH